MNDDGQLSETSNEEGAQKLTRPGHEVVNLRNRPEPRGLAQQYQLTSSEVTNTEAEGEYGGEEEGGTARDGDESSSDLSSATESVRNLNEAGQ